MVIYRNWRLGWINGPEAKTLLDRMALRLNDLGRHEAAENVSRMFMWIDRRDRSLQGV
jgi:hypothetical protein